MDCRERSGYGSASGIVQLTPGGGSSAHESRDWLR